MPRHLGVRALAPLVAAGLTTALAGCGDTDPDTGPGGTTVDFTSLDNVRWAEDLGCGFGFGRVDTGEAFWITVRTSGNRSAPLARSVTLPAPEWDAEVVAGHQLVANWCQDVILDPQAEVTATWEIVAGTLTFVGDIPELTTDGRPGRARAELSDLVIVDSDGTRTELDDIALTNDQWGFFAG